MFSGPRCGCRRVCFDRIYFMSNRSIYRLMRLHVIDNLRQTDNAFVSIFRFMRLLTLTR